MHHKVRRRFWTLNRTPNCIPRVDECAGERARAPQQTFAIGWSLFIFVRHLIPPLNSFVVFAETTVYSMFYPTVMVRNRKYPSYFRLREKNLLCKNEYFRDKTFDRCAKSTRIRTRAFFKGIFACLQWKRKYSADINRFRNGFIKTPCGYSR